MNQRTHPIDLVAAYPDDPESCSKFLYSVLDVTERIQQALGVKALPHSAHINALKNETDDLYALQQLALVYAEHVLGKDDWINLHRYVAQLAVSEGAQSAWQWKAMDLMSFALSDYLADVPDAGDVLLHEMMVLTRQGAADRVSDVYRHHHLNAYDDLRDALAHDRLDQNDTLDDLCTAVVSSRTANSAGQRTSS